MLAESVQYNPEKYLLLTGLAGAAKDTAGYTKEADNLLTLGGAMGAAVSMALGVALSAPGEQVAVITGDGELMMNIGALATVPGIGIGSALGVTSAFFLAGALLLYAFPDTTGRALDD